MPDRRAVELNELMWWSRWEKLSRRDERYILSSEVFRESFFNRAGSLTCGSLTAAATWAERIFASRGLDSTVYALESCKGAEGLLGAGYKRVDVMTVLASKKVIEDGRPQTVGISRDPVSWASAYLRSFYGDDGLLDAVVPTVARLQRSRGVTFLVSRMDETTAGVSALFRTPGLAGVYCVGTIPEHRGRGVATSLLAAARRMADSEGRSLILQTLDSDGALRFYLDRGFAKMYTKLVLEKRLK